MPISLPIDVLAGRAKRIQWAEVKNNVFDVVQKYGEIRREHMLLYAPVLLGLGILCYFSLSFEPSSRLILNLWIGSFAIFILCLQIYLQRNNFKVYFIIFGVVFLFFTGIFVAQYRSIMVHEPQLKHELKFAKIEGVISAVDLLPQGQGGRIVLQNVSIEKFPPAETPAMVRVKVRGDMQIYQPGQRVAALASLNPPAPPVTPHGFDFQRYAYFKKLGAVGFTYRAPEIIEQGHNTMFFGFWEGVRLRISAYVSAAVPSALQGVMITFLTGEKSYISKDDMTAIRGSGLAHLLAISGLHVGLVSGFVFFFSRLFMASFQSLALQYPIKKYAAALALICSFFYMFLVGASIPTQRAMMMSGIALFAIMIDRSPFSLRMVALAAFIILISYPESLVSASFQMSFAAVTALVWFYDTQRVHIQAFYQDSGWMRRFVLYFMGIFITTLIAGSATGLFAVYHFQTWSVYSTLANIIAMPIMGFIVMPMAVLSYIFMPIGLAELPLYVMGLGVSQIIKIAHIVTNIDGAVILLPAFSGFALACISVGALCLMIGPGLLRIFGAGILIWFMAAWLSYQAPDQIFIGPEGKLSGLYFADTQEFSVSSKTTERYARENWIERLGLKNEDVINFKDHKNFICAAGGCRLERSGLKISFPLDEYAAQEECLWANLIIVDQYGAFYCEDKSVRIIGPFSTKRTGAMRFDIKKGRLIKESVQGVRGVRPWTGN